MTKRLLLAIVTLAAIAISTGCASIVNEDRKNENGGENIPWNTPAGWERDAIF